MSIQEVNLPWTRFLMVRLEWTGSITDSGGSALTRSRHAMFDRITSDPAILAGKPHLKGTRISVEMILEWIASGATLEDIATTYPHLAPEAIRQAVRYAARFLENEVVIDANVVA